MGISVLVLILVWGRWYLWVSGRGVIWRMKNDALGDLDGAGAGSTFDQWDGGGVR